MPRQSSTGGASSCAALTVRGRLPRPDVPAGQSGVASGPVRVARADVVSDRTM
jgi:hypothetical protein